MAQPHLTIVPLTLRDANAFVEQTHRHHGAARGCKFCIGIVDEVGKVRGVAIVGRPTSRVRDDGFTAEVTRLSTDGCPNACSALYAASWRAAKAMGYLRLGTYILVTEHGTSLRAAGWSMVGEVRGRSWSCPSRPRVDRHPLADKQLWQVA